MIARMALLQVERINGSKTGRHGEAWARAQDQGSFSFQLLALPTDANKKPFSPRPRQTDIIYVHVALCQRKFLRLRGFPFCDVWFQRPRRRGPHETPGPKFHQNLVPGVLRGSSSSRLLKSKYLKTKPFRVGEDSIIKFRPCYRCGEKLLSLEENHAETDWQEKVSGRAAARVCSKLQPPV